MVSNFIERMIGTDDVQARGGKLPREQILAIIHLVRIGLVSQEDAIVAGASGRITLIGDDLAEALLLMSRIDTGDVDPEVAADVLSLAERRLVFVDGAGHPDAARVRNILGLI